MNAVRLGIGLLSLLLPLASASAQTYHVDASRGYDGASGLSWTEAFATVTRGLDAARLAAAAGGLPRVNVAEGVYTVARARVDHPVIIVGAYPSGGGARDRATRVSRLDAFGATGVLTFADGSGGSTLDGFTVTGASSLALYLEDDVLVRNCVIADNAVGVSARVGRIVRNHVLRSTRTGISASLPAWTAPLCPDRIVVSGNLVEEAADTGIFAKDPCGRFGRPAVFVQHNRIVATRVGRAAVALGITCCPSVFNNLVVGSEGPGVILGPAMGDFGEVYPGPLGPISFLTVIGSADAAIVVSAPAEATDLVLSHAILWNNTGGDIQGLPAVSTITRTLSQAPLPGANNMSGQDPLLVSGGGADAYLAQVPAGQAVDSPAVDAGGMTANEAGLEDRTTRTDRVRDAGAVDLGFHAEPTVFSLLRGANPQAIPVHMSGVVPPVLDVGAVPPPSPPLLFYRVDADEPILLRRVGPDIDVRFAYQEFD